MMIVLANVGLAFVFGFALAIYFFFYRLNLSRLWRWSGGIVGGLILGAVMAMIDFWIIWPPVNTLLFLGGFAFMILIALLMVGNPNKVRQTDKG